MTTQTILPVDSEQLRVLSERNGEPSWLAEDRQKALELAGKLELPVFEKTKIERWKLNDYGQHKQNEVIASVGQVPAAIADLVKEQQEGGLDYSAQLRRGICEAERGIGGARRHFHGFTNSG